MENPVGHEINAMELATENDSVPTPQSLEKVEAEAEHQESFSKAGNNPDSLIADSIAGGYIEPRESPPRDCSECHGTGWRHVGGGFGSICYYCGGTGRRRY